MRKNFLLAINGPRRLPIDKKDIGIVIGLQSQVVKFTTSAIQVTLLRTENICDLVHKNQAFVRKKNTFKLTIVVKGYILNLLCACIECMDISAF